MLRFNFDLLTMIALLASASLICAAPGSPYVVFGLVMVVLPIAIMIIAISAPKQGTSLNVTSRWYIFLLGKTWFFTVGFCTIAFLVICFFGFLMPEVGYRFERMLQGDFRAYVVHVPVQLDGVTEADLDSGVTPIFDERGLVGECWDYYEFVQMINPSGNVGAQSYIQIHTDLRDLKQSGELHLWRDNGKIMVSKDPRPAR